jgi:hypothetical protein
MSIKRNDSVLFSNEIRIIRENYRKIQLLGMIWIGSITTQ